MFRIIVSPKEDIDFGKRFARTLYGHITGLPKDRRLAFIKLKNQLEYPDLCQAADFVDKNVNEKLKSEMFGNPLPKEYKDLGKCKISGSTENLISEINWTLISIRKYTYEISLFLVYKEYYENNLLTGDFEEAEKYLSKIEKEICVSLWSLENRFLLAEYTGGTPENKEFLSKFNEENGSEYFTKSLAHYLSIRAEKSLSVERYTVDLYNALNTLKAGKRKEHINYYLFNLSFLNNLTFDSYPEIIAYDFQHSVIDKYLNLRKTLFSLLTMANNMVDRVEDGKEIKGYIINRLNYILRKINDPLLFKLKLFASDKIFPAFDETKSVREIGVIDKYTAGLYAEVEEDLRDLMLEKPTQFDLYTLYVKVLVYQKKEFVPIGKKNSLQNSILHEMHKIISVSVDPIGAGMVLRRIANNLSSNIISYGIIDFVGHQTQGRSERKLFARLSYNPANPIISEIYTDPAAQLKYLEFLQTKFPKSLSIDFLYKKIENSDNLVNFAAIIPKPKYKVEEAKLFQQKKEFDKAAQIWDELINEGSDIPVIETAIRNLYKCYQELKEYDKCISLWVKSFFYNQFIVDKVETAPILIKMQESRFRIVKPTIDLPLFYTLNSPDETDVHTAFEKFNLSVGCCKPSELLDKFDTFDNQRIISFLKYTCSQEILKHSIHINGSKDRLEERLKILNFLKEKDLSSIRFYEDEIKTITNILIIQKGLLELDESKIYVNEQGIINNELKEFEAVYERFKAIGAIGEKGQLKILKGNNGSRLVAFEYNEETSKSGKIEFSTNPVYDVYKELFDAIKDKFLHSKFGIVAYLSTRIRHGVLIGEIRPIFEKHRLITQKEGESGAYRKNNHWDQQYLSETSINKALIQDLLRDFSYVVDGLIFDLIQKYLQVYEVEKKPDGWFNYDFEENDLFWFSIRALSVKDFNEFANDAFEILWEKTDKNLTVIRQKIQSDISNLFNDMFEKLERDVTGVLGNNSQNLLRSVRDCSTEVQTVLARISGWFKRSGTITSDFKLENLINIVMQYCNKSRPGQIINLKQDLHFDKTIKGDYYTHFADLIRIFIENILKHADDKTPIIEANIGAKEDRGFLVITIENGITNTESVDALKNVWEGETIHLEKLVSENKSGFHKAYKILKSDLASDGNTFTTELTDENKFVISIYIKAEQIVK